MGFLNNTASVGLKLYCGMCLAGIIFFCIGVSAGTQNFVWAAVGVLIWFLAGLMYCLQQRMKDLETAQLAQLPTEKNNYRRPSFSKV